MGFATGTRISDADITSAVQKRVRLIVARLSKGEIDPPDASRQLIDLIVKAARKLQGIGGVDDDTQAR